MDDLYALYRSSRLVYLIYSNVRISHALRGEGTDSSFCTRRALHRQYFSMNRESSYNDGSYNQKLTEENDEDSTYSTQKNKPTEHTSQVRISAIHCIRRLNEPHKPGTNVRDSIA